MTVEPAVVKIGDKGKLLVAFKGSSDKIEEVKATVRENPEMVFQLNNEGKSGDLEAGDKIWSYEVSVPYDAPPGIYHIDFKALDINGEVIYPKDAVESNYRRSGTVEVRVK